MITIAYKNKSIFTLGCSGIQNSTSGVITSPGYPINYTSNTKCEWRIAVSPSKAILIQFDDFDVENDNECGYDKLTVQELVGVRLFSQLCIDLKSQAGQLCFNILHNSVMSLTALCKFQKKDHALVKARYV